MPDDPAPPPGTITRAEAAALLRVGLRQVDAWLRAGRLQPVEERPGLLRRDAVEALAAARAERRRATERRLPPSPRLRHPDAGD